MLVDTHAHLDDEQLLGNLTQVLERAAAAGVHKTIAIGTTAASSRKCIEIAKENPSVFAAVGIQPNYCADAKSDDWEAVVKLAASPKVVAIGETGLDRYWDHTPFEMQQDYFDRHLRLSHQTGLAFVVHMRDCGADILEMLVQARQRSALRGVMHSFTGDAELCAACLELGLYISFAGMLTYKKSAALRDVAGQVPLDRILVETDSPYLSPHPCRGQRPNEPALIVHTAACLADVHGVDCDEISRHTTANAHALFGL